MKKLILTLLFSLMLFFVPQVHAEEISDFTQLITIEKDGTLQVEETIAYDFQGESKHGIFRDIPFKYKGHGGNFNLRLTDVNVTDESGSEYEYVVSNQGDDKRIKIGKENELLSGKHVYVIKYKIKRAINFFEANDELYWNVTGDKWPVEIRQTKSTIVLPEVAKENEVKMECYTGVYGSTANCVSKRFVYEGANMVKQVVFIDDILQAKMGLTVVLALPKGVVNPPSALSKIIDTIKDNYILALPFFVFALLYYLWNKSGRDTKGRGTIVAQFEAPDGLSPMAVGTLYDEKADNKDFSANIINLAVKGYLKIVKTETGILFKSDDYALVALAERGRGQASEASEAWPQGVLSKSEREILSALFKEKNLETDAKKLDEIKTLSGLKIVDKTVFLSGLKNVFYKDLSNIKSHIYKELVEAGYYRNNPQTIRIAYSVLGGIFIFLCVPFGSVMGLLAAISFLVSGIIIIIFAQIMPAKTEKGALAKEHIQGLKTYLNVAEKDRINFHNAPEKKPEIFESLLPFAMVLGVEKQWAEQFADIYENREPSWYAGNHGQMFSAMALTDSLKGFSANASSAAASTPSSASSGGSGFSGGGSGGGFGGGGGGSW